MNTLIPNRIIIDSIPINREVKKYWIRKFKRIERNCGGKEAQRKFKELRVDILTYLSDNHRHESMAQYFEKSGFRSNSFLKTLFLYADCQPHYLLNFLKFVSSDMGKKKKDIAAQEAAWKDCKIRLEEVPLRVNSTPPRCMRNWIALALASDKSMQSAYWNLRRPIRGKSPWTVVHCANSTKTEWTSFLVEDFSSLARDHSFEEWCEYWRKWRMILKKVWTGSLDPRYSQVNRRFTPDVYKDRDHEGHSITHDEDYFVLYQELTRTGMANGHNHLSRETQDYVLSLLDDSVADYLSRQRNPETMGPQWPSDFKWDILHYDWVGRVHQVPKKGTSDELRDIAVPNRFYQQALIPAYRRMHRFQEILPRDASMNQARFDKRITSRVSNQHLYSASIDLSKATDNLPYRWAALLVDSLRSRYGWSSEEERLSFKLFDELIKAPWKCWGWKVKWEVGQPLGSLPSFGFLTATHFLFLESLSADCGLSHSPYFTVGDDVIVTNKKLRGRYIRTMQSRKIPISLSKSYSGRLVEFAGKTYISNQLPFFTTDHQAIGWNSLFDYQVATGILIPWNNLPEKYRRRCTRVCGTSCDHARASYELAQKYLIPARGSSKWLIETIDDELVASIASDLWITKSQREEKRQTARDMYSGLENMAGHPVKLLSTEYAEKDGYYFRYHPVDLPQWYLDKYRPCSTDKALEACSSALLAKLVDDANIDG